MSLHKLELVPNFLLREWAGEDRVFCHTRQPHAAPAASCGDNDSTRCMQAHMCE